ncbi:glycosyltransferase [Rhizobium sp. SL86]|uniref:glycosyltransferase n=1 Tax=Rhizobium sp. SL86 TaxID=2995148 RepID=UPI0022758F28|nr:glycosyltransferase [Rhizobium sp. SL86]MCY1666600.1 glycosyltransferase [Rhizobium sp. SL86]
MIIVLTYGKVFTTSLVELMSGMFPGDVFDSHTLQPFFPELLREYETVARVDLSGLNRATTNHAIYKRMATAERRGETITFISGVRDPVARSLSVAMQLYQELFAEASDLENSEECVARRIAHQISSLWQSGSGESDARRRLAEKTIRSPLTWFQEELVTPFGFDVFSREFNKEEGYTIYTNGRMRLLLFRVENGSAGVERGLRELFPEQDFHLPHANSGDEKRTGLIYRELRKCFKMPRVALEALYDQPAIKHFYTEDETRSAIERWVDDASFSAVCQDSQAERAPMITTQFISAENDKATIVIPLYNNAAYIGALLDSIITQWRPDLELLVVDDASIEASLDIVLQKLAANPHIPSTILSHETNCVHATLGDITKHAKGRIIIQADSDDIMLPGRIAKTLEEFDKNPLCRLVTSNALMISESGLPLGLLDSDPRACVVRQPDDTVRKWGAPWIGATSAFHRSVLEAFPSVDTELFPYGFDMISPLRATLIGHHHHLAEPLVGWRQHRRNSHRLVGTFSDQISLQERHLSIELMALAQRIRDVEWAQQSRYCIDPELSDSALLLSQGLFFQTFERWSRLRSRMLAAATRTVPNPDEGAGYRPPIGIPAIATMRPEHRYVMGLRSPISKALSMWPGFYQPEEKHIWTSRFAAFALRIPYPNVKAIALTLGGTLLFPPQTVEISVNFGQPTIIDLPANGTNVFQIPLERQPHVKLPWGNDIVIISIFVPKADAPVNIKPDYLDARTLGAGIFALELLMGDS